MSIGILQGAVQSDGVYDLALRFVVVVVDDDGCVFPPSDERKVYVV